MGKIADFISPLIKGLRKNTSADASDQQELEQQKTHMTEPPQGKGLNKTRVIGGLALLGITIGCLIAFGNDSSPKPVKKEEAKNSVMQQAGGSHLKYVPKDYSEDRKMEDKRNKLVLGQNENKPVPEAPSVPAVPKQPTSNSRLTPEEKEKAAEYEAMLKAYSSPIRFELKEEQ